MAKRSFLIVPLSRFERRREYGAIARRLPFPGICQGKKILFPILLMKNFLTKALAVVGSMLPLAAAFAIPAGDVTSVGTAATDVASSLTGAIGDLLPVLIPVLVVGFVIMLIIRLMHRSSSVSVSSSPDFSRFSALANASHSISRSRDFWQNDRS